MNQVGLYILAAFTLSATSLSTAATRYVNANNPAPTLPYTSWSTAATTIQDAINASISGDLILVTNGIYQSGSTLTDDGMQNRVVVTNAITVQAVNGPSVTTIDGLNAMRGAYLGNGAVLTGFTVTNGNATDGAGVFCASADERVLACQLVDNSASRYGGGIYGGTLAVCMLSGNSAQVGAGAYSSRADDCTFSKNTAINTIAGSSSGGGAYSSLLNRCLLSENSARYGGGAHNSVANNCTFINNSAIGGDYCFGGGVNGGTLNNCTLIANSAHGLDHPRFWGTGGGAANATLNNCTVTGNTATGDTGVGGGVHASALNNCIVIYNSAAIAPNVSSSALNYSCTITLPPGGFGNITNAPLFVNTNGWSDLRLQSSSPCINSGLNTYASGSTDLDGNPRVNRQTVDMGAYEFQRASSVISYAWLQKYGLTTDGSADYIDSDGDSMTNSREWVAATDPTDSTSVLRILSATPGTSNNVVVTWSSVGSRRYLLLRGTTVAGYPPFVAVDVNITGLEGTTSFNDTNPPADPTVFYRVAVWPP